MKKIAVLMAAYNGERYIRTQIDSILNQKGDFDLYLIVRDDGSTDSTKNILDEYQKKGLLSWYTGRNLRTAKNFMNLLYHHKGYDYYAFSDQDDFWLDRKIENGIKAIEKYEEACLYFSNLEIVDSDLNSLGFNAHKKIPYYDFYSATMNAGFAGCTFIFNNKLADIIQKNRIPENITMHDAFLFKVCACIGGSFVYDFTPSIKYRQHGDNVEGFPTNKIDTLKNRISIINKQPQISASQEMKEIIDLYCENIDVDKLEWLKLIVNYKNKFNRFKLVFSSKVKYPSINSRITKALTIFKGNF